MNLGTMARKEQIWLVVLAATALAASGWVISRWLATREVVSIDIHGMGDRVVRIMSCDRAGVWLWAWSKPHLEQVQAEGSEGALAAQRSALVRISEDGTFRETHVGQGLIASFASAGDGALWAVLLERYGLPGERSRTLASSDGGNSWRDAGAPNDVIGVAFETEAKGYAWSSERVYRTDDSGRTWRGLDVKPFHIRRGPGGGRLVLGAEGELWVPLNRGSPDERSLPSPPTAEVLVIRPDLSTSQMATWDSESIEGVAPDGQGGALVVLQPITRGGYRVEQVISRPGAGAPSQPRYSKERSPEDVLSRGAVVLIHEVTFDPKATWSSDPPQSIAVSADAGATWNTRNITHEAIDSVCLTDEGIWTASGRSKRLTFHPLRLR